ncbi:hypothetical protein [Pseudomonas arsenicoxydans]|uniref:hypothetical protein n=1 Tax=Pseudomonas arsenicoxydans TaxID=702115 RepID=UPI001128D7E5|nr:hypothetical protein [Pseudomonas arsenicoxydans]
MKEARRRRALTAWRELFSLSDNCIDAEDRYDTLLRSADKMECEGLITSIEWRKLVQQAATLFASNAECMREARAKQNRHVDIQWWAPAKVARY